MRAPLPPPGVPDFAGFAPLPIAVLNVNRLLVTVWDTPIDDSPPPLLHALPSAGSPPNVVRVTKTGSGSGSPIGWKRLSLRSVAAPTSRPTASHALCEKPPSTLLKRP